MRFVGATVIAVVLAGCGTSQPSATQTADDIIASAASVREEKKALKEKIRGLPIAKPSDVAKARATVKASLKDPDSAKFSSEVTMPGAVCGQINAKNSYGGYTGNRNYAYVVSSGDVILYERTSDSIENLKLLERIGLYCEK